METRGGRSHGHRRFGSTGGLEINGEYSFSYHHDGAGRVSNNSPNKQIMKRCRSHRMFSCITGGV
ncbi:Homeobox-leucine zipper protein HOX32 [Bienertia sinuspersici]